MRSLVMNPTIHQNRQVERAIESAQGQLSLRLTFHWLGDRYGHSLLAKAAMRETSICSSVEGDPQDALFSRPAFQELSAERIEGNEVICLVGKSNRAYWSASIEPLREGVGFLFDVCCKQANAPRSEYVLKNTFEPQLPSGLMTPLDENWYCEVQAVQHPEFGTRLDGKRETIEIHGASQNTLRYSRVRWMYRWEIKPYSARK